MSDDTLPPAVRRSIARWSALLSLAAVAIPAFGMVSMTIAQNRDHAWGPRLVMAASCLAIVGMGRAPARFARWMPTVASGWACLAMAFFGYRYHLGNATGTHLTAYQLLYVLPLMTMRTIRSAAAYSAVSIGIVVAAYAGLETPQVPMIASVMSLVVLGVGTTGLALSRARAEEALEASHELLEQRVDARTEQLQNEVRVRRAAEADALRASHAKSQFMATMSHELRTPLNAIIGYTELVQDDLSDREPDDPLDEVQEDLGRVRKSADHLLQMISDVLDLASIEAGELSLEPTDVDVCALADELARLLEPSRAASGNSLVLDVPDGMSVRTDPVRLRQILLNLLTNGLKFTVDGEVRLTVVAEGDQRRFEVRDDGIGIAPADQERIFASFAQVDGSSTRSRDGVGLGLALSRDLAERLGGTLTVESTPGEGSTFTLTLHPSSTGSDSTGSDSTGSDSIGSD